jgi:hypothetical protein
MLVYASQKLISTTFLFAACVSQWFVGAVMYGKGLSYFGCTSWQQAVDKDRMQESTEITEHSHFIRKNHDQSLMNFTIGLGDTNQFAQRISWE